MHILLTAYCAHSRDSRLRLEYKIIRNILWVHCADSKLTGSLWTFIQDNLQRLLGISVSYLLLCKT